MNHILSCPANFVVPNPVLIAEFMATIRKVYRAPFGLPASVWMLALGAFILGTENQIVYRALAGDSWQIAVRRV